MAPQAVRIQSGPALHVACLRTINPHWQLFRVTYHFVFRALQLGRIPQSGIRLSQLLTISSLMMFMAYPPRNFFSSARDAYVTLPHLRVGSQSIKTRDRRHQSSLTGGQLQSIAPQFVPVSLDLSSRRIKSKPK